VPAAPAKASAEHEPNIYHSSLCMTHYRRSAAVGLSVLMRLFSSYYA